MQLRKECECGQLVWDLGGYADKPNRRIGYLSQITCTGCGTDHSIAPTQMERLKYGGYILRKRISVYGLRRGLGMGVTDAFTLPRERHDVKKVNKASTDATVAEYHHRAVNLSARMRGDGVG
jgi:hypothetical protein